MTMRPSDVPTYVEHGAADIGITGKDVLLEQAEREVYELLDLGFGDCRMIVAAREGDDALGESLRRLGRVRIATKYPRIAAEHFASTGRQAEIVEVKGSVELAPLTGLVDGIVDLTATGTTLAENRLRVLEEIVVCTARLIANPVSHKLKAEAIDRLVERIRADVRRSRAVATRVDAAGGRARPLAVEVARRSSPRCAPAATTRCCASPSASTAPSSARASCAWTRTSSRRPSGCSSRRCSTASAPPSPTCARWPRRSSASRSACELPEGQTSRWPRCRCAAPASTCPAGARRIRPPS